MSNPASALDETPLGAAEHAYLSLRRVGAELSLLVADWIEAHRDREESALLGHMLGECRAQLATLVAPIPGVDDRASAASPTAQLEALRAYLGSRERANARLRRSTPLARVCAAAELSQLELDLLLLAALPEESSLWGTLFGAIAADATQRRPTVHLVLNFWLARPSRRADLHQMLAEGGLLRYQLLELLPPELPLADRALALREGVWPALLGLDAVDPLLRPHLLPSSVAATPVLEPERAAQAEALRRQVAAGETSRLIVHGAPGTGRRTLARFVAGELPLVEIRLPTEEPPAGFVAAAARHALLRGAGLLIVASAAPGGSIAVELPVPSRMPCFLVVPDRVDVQGTTFTGAVRMALPPPLLRERAQLWQAALERRQLTLDAPSLARRHRLTGGEVEGAVVDAMSLARLAGRGEPTHDDVARAVRNRPSTRLEALARRRQPRTTWDDLVLPPPALQQLRGIVTRMQHRDTVFEEWGLAANASRQTGVVALFVGPTGTGKTLAAEVVASQLGLDIYCVDLSQVVSKYIGETEKNLARLFDAVAGNAAVLFFDEADGLFGKRTETRDAHDRYANLEVSYLLTRLEDFDGVAILASNLRQNVDAAFLRRLEFVVEFAPPDATARAQLWRRHLVCQAPLASNIDVERLAEAFPVSGAHIRNAVVAAAFGAAEDGAPLGVAHLLAAMRDEYDKLGKPFPTNQLG